MSRLLRLPEVMARTGLTRSRLYAAISAGTFKKPVKLSPRAIAFPEAEVDAWVAARIAEREDA